MNPRVAVLAWALAFVIAAYGLYRVKYEVLGLRTEIAQTSRALEQERESLHASAAEWAYLTRPDRLEKLSAKYLHLQPMQPAQVASIEALDARLEKVAARSTVMPVAVHAVVEEAPGDEE